MLNLIWSSKFIIVAVGWVWELHAKVQGFKVLMQMLWNNGLELIASSDWPYDTDMRVKIIKSILIPVMFYVPQFKKTAGYLSVAIRNWKSWTCLSLATCDLASTVRYT